MFSGYAATPRSLPSVDQLPETLLHSPRNIFRALEMHLSKDTSFLLHICKSGTYEYSEDFSLLRHGNEIKEIKVII